MLNSLITNLPNNIFIKLSYLKQDYIGVHFDINVLLNLFLGSSIALGLITISCLIGKKLRHLILGHGNTINYNCELLVDIALGYITIASGMAILGLLSLLNPLIISSYLMVLILISCYPYGFLLKAPNTIYSLIKPISYQVKQNKLISFWILLFVALALINLINPEIREDQYHVDFPKMYLNNQTIMIPPRESFHVSGSPMLGEMYYAIGIFLWSEESARYIHFIFYILVIITLYEFVKLKEYKFADYVPLLFVTAPAVIHETSSMYVDFEWIFCFLLSVFILIANKKLTYKMIALSGFLLGGMLASKLWTIVFIPVSIVYLLYLSKDINLSEKLKRVLLFSFTTLIAPSIWFLRAYILTKDPIFPAFIQMPSLENHVDYYGLSHYLGLNTAILNPLNYITTFSPLFFLGCVFFLYKFRQNLKELISLRLFQYFLLLLLVYVSIQYPFGRYLLGLYVLFIFVASIGLNKIVSDFKFMGTLIYALVTIMFLYYFINSVLVLPYSIGFDDKNKYLTRILSRDWSSYYDFDRKFDKFISKKDYVATYGVFGYYYANFKYLDVSFAFDQTHKSFEILKKNGFTKLFIKGGNINYFCKQINLKDCSDTHYSLVSSYTSFPGYYLYNIK